MVRWNGEDLKQKDSAGVTDDSGGSFSGGLQQGYELGSLTDGLVAYFPFDGDVKDRALDNNGTDNTSAGYVSGKVGGQAKDFDGNDDFISGIGDPYTFSFVQNSARFCVTGWVKGSGDFVGNEINQGDKGFISTIQSDGDVRIVLYDGSGSKTIDLVTSSQPVSTSSWDHIAVTGNGSQIKIFVNGTQEASGTVSRFSSGKSSRELEIGYVQSYSAFEGQMDDIRIYERPLSQPEIKALYQRTSTQEISDKDRLTSGLVGHWPLNEDGAGKAYDLSGNNFDSTSVTGTSTAVGLGGAKARSFDGGDDNITLEAFEWPSVWSMSIWFNTTTSGDEILYRKEDSNYVYFRVNDESFSNPPNFVVRNTGASGGSDSNNDKLYSNRDVLDGKWHHAAMIDDGTNTVLYIDGDQVDSMSSSSHSGSTNEYLGSNKGSGYYFNGELADARFYNRPLKKSEIETLARNGGLNV